MLNILPTTLTQKNNNKTKTIRRRKSKVCFNLTFTTAWNTTTTTTIIMIKMTTLRRKSNMACILQVVANYFGNEKRYREVADTEIHWAGGRTQAPPDEPECGFDGSKCPPDGKLISFFIISVFAFVLSMCLFVYV